LIFGTKKPITKMDMLIFVIDDAWRCCVNVSLTKELESAVRQRVSSGRYQNASEVVRAGLRALDLKEAQEDAELARIQKLLVQGSQQVAGGLTVPLDETLGRVDADIATMDA
jgi:antitoxin ParD1/3/4